MSDDDQAEFSDLEGSVIDENALDDKRNRPIYDPTGQYAYAYARAGNPVQTSSPIVAKPSQPSQMPVKAERRVRFADPVDSGFHPIKSSQGRVVARVVSRHILPAGYNVPTWYNEVTRNNEATRNNESPRYNGTHLSDIGEDEPLREPLSEQYSHHLASSSQYSGQSGDADEFENTSPRFAPQSPFTPTTPSSSRNPFASTTSPYEATTSPFASNPSYSTPPAKRVSRHNTFSTQYDFSDFEQSPSSVPSSDRHQLTSNQYRESYYEGRRTSQDFIRNDDGYIPAEEYPATSRQAKRSFDESIDDGSESGLFVKVSGHRVVPAGGEGSRGAGPKLRKRFSHDDLLAYDDASPQTRPGQLPANEYFSKPGKNRAESRFSGGQNNWGVNKVPVLVPEDEVSDAALLKRGLKRGDGAKVCKRGYGANDPENIAIVNMFEKDRMAFEAICNKLNADRIANGKTPSLTPNGCQTRYNRNAPIFFAAEGREFIPLGMRRRGQRMDDIAPSIPKVKEAWSEELDVALVETVKEWESKKWEDIAALFKLRTGVDMDAGSCAHRHHII